MKCSLPIGLFKRRKKTGWPPCRWLVLRDSCELLETQMRLDWARVWE